MRIGNPTRHQIDKEIVDAAVAAMLDLRDMLQLIVGGLDDPRPPIWLSIIEVWHCVVSHAR